MGQHKHGRQVAPLLARPTTSDATIRSRLQVTSAGYIVHHTGWALAGFAIRHTTDTVRVIVALIMSYWRRDL